MSSSHHNSVFISQKINEKPQVIMDYESGKAIPNNQVMSKIERALGECKEQYITIMSLFC